MGNTREHAQGQGILVAEMLEQFLCKCKQLQLLPEEAYMHTQSANCDMQCTDDIEEDDIDTFCDASEALKKAHNAVSDLELEAMRLRCLLKAVHAHMDEQLNLQRHSSVAR